MRSFGGLRSCLPAFREKERTSCAGCVRSAAIYCDLLRFTTTATCYYLRLLLLLRPRNDTSPARCGAASGAAFPFSPLRGWISVRGYLGSPSEHSHLPPNRRRAPSINTSLYGVPPLACQRLKFSMHAHRYGGWMPSFK